MTLFFTLTFVIFLVYKHTKVNATPMIFKCSRRRITPLLGKGYMTMTTDERMLATSFHAISITNENLKQKQRCPTCWMHQSICICNSVKSLAASCPPLRTHVALFMHYKEYGRASNTGKLLSMLAPTKSSMIVYGSDKEAKFLESLQSKPSLVLYPGANSKSISDYKDWSREHFDAGKEVTLCVMDSTWNLSKAMERAIPPDIPRVNIDFQVDGPSLFLSRKQSTTLSKVSTIEAVMLALSSLGEDPQALTGFIPALKLSVDAVQRQRGRPSIYGHKLPLNYTSLSDASSSGEEGEGQVAGPYKLVEKPGKCPCCGDENGASRNLGIVRSADERDKKLRVWKCKVCNETFRIPLQ